MAEEIKEAQFATPQEGSAKLDTQLPGQAVTASGLAGATGGIAPGNLMEVDIDKALFEFESDDTPLMSLMLYAKKVPVKSSVVQHYMIDEEKTTVTTNAALAASTANQAVLPLDANDQDLCQLYGTLRVRGVNGYTADGQTVTPGRDLQLYVTGKDTTTNNPIVRAVNGPKANATDVYCTTPAIPKGTVLDILANAVNETLATVPPDSVVPVPKTLYLQKRIITSVVSDYFESQAKRIPFGKAVQVEHAIRKFKRAGNRTLWIGGAGYTQVNDPKTGPEMVYFTDGVRWQFSREIQHTGKWTYEEFIALAKMAYTGADVPSEVICLCGKNFLEGVQCVDFSDHPEVKISVVTNKLGWTLTSIHTVFGDIQLKRDATLDSIGYSNSAAIIGLDRLVHYQRTPEHKDSDRVEDHEASRESNIAWDALGLKGSCHMFINGEGTEVADGRVTYVLWSQEDAPAGDDLVDGAVYYLLNDVPSIDATAVHGTLWQYTVDGGTGSWSKYTGDLSA